MERRKAITEEDILLTELLIARSCRRLEQSVLQASLRASFSATENVRKHPLAAAGAAAGAGILLYGIFSVLNRKDPAAGDNYDRRRSASRPDMAMEIFSLIIPMVTPYITAYIKKHMGRTPAESRK